ncbi:hypothetical protein MiAbB_01266 [Microcystis aeruginosa NIES-4285]|uniref:Uncharacterized protein n=1 Tax=Microcystis aeruginosa NIES-4285 TaxID=2497681 RepID=A0A402DAY2_MICAE|nr:hypothetical protein MiAbB_01266 [Microcystis aeruginosa NIES-4285]
MLRYLSIAEGFVSYFDTPCRKMDGEPETQIFGKPGKKNSFYLSTQPNRQQSQNCSQKKDMIHPIIERPIFKHNLVP